MTGVRNFPTPTPPSAAANLRTVELCAEAMMLFRNIDELARVSPAGAGTALRLLAAELAKRCEGSA